MSRPIYKLGKRPPRIDSRTFKLSKYLRLPPIPEEVSWITKLKAAEAIPMYLNDQLGDCVIAAAGHMVQQWNFYAGHPFQPTDADILAAYGAVGGYNPDDPGSDQGADMLTMLNYWRKTGLAGHRILAYMSLDWTNLEEFRAAILLFGSAYMGIQLPLSVQGADDWVVGDGGIYTSQGSPGGWGGHCVNFPASSAITHTCETWGSMLKCSHNFLMDYADEGYVVLSPDWMNVVGLSPSAFNLNQLMADLAAL
jgi:hypothetical protein